MTIKRILAAIGILIMAVGVIQLVQPRGVWRFTGNLVVGHLYEPPPTALFIIGAFSIVLGAFLLYVGLRKLTVFSTLIWVLGAILFVAGVLMVLAPEFFRDFANSIFFNRSDTAKLAMTYIGGVIRFFIGVLLLIASLRRRPERQMIQPAVESPSE